MFYLDLYKISIERQIEDIEQSSKNQLVPQLETIRQEAEMFSNLMFKIGIGDICTRRLKITSRELYYTGSLFDYWHDVDWPSSQCSILNIPKKCSKIVVNNWPELKQKILKKVSRRLSGVEKFISPPIASDSFIIAGANWWD